MSELKAIIDRIQEAYLKQLDQTFESVAHPPLLISFSAVPAAGKTSLALELVPRLETIRICRDDIRGLIDVFADILTTAEKVEVLNAVTFGTYAQISTAWPNRRVLLDASLDRSYTEVKKRLGETPLFLIRIEPIWGQIESRITARFKLGTPGYAQTADMARNRQEWEALGKVITPDYIWNQASVSVEKAADEITRAILRG